MYLRGMKPNDNRSIHLSIPGLALLLVFWASGDLKGQVTEDPSITRVMESWKAYNLEHPEVRGWRVQIIATVDRRQMESIKRKFENLYPEYKVHFVHNEPYYLLKTGAFLYMQKAQSFMRKLQSEYPSAILVRDEIEVQELLLYDQ
jgi:hypothetical protein